MKDWKALLRIIGSLLMAEGGAILSCLIPAIGFHDGTVAPILVSGLFTFFVGLLLNFIFSKYRIITDTRMSSLLVVFCWVILSVFATLPFLATGVIHNFVDAFFESMSGFTSTGATVFTSVEHLPKSILFWRALSQWIGGFGIILVVLAIVPKLGINKYSLYTAEASGADNTGKVTTSMSATIRHTLIIYVSLTIFFIVMLCLADMPLFDSVSFTFMNISSGGFSIHDDSVASLTHTQQYILAAIMFFSGINFTLLFYFFTFRWGKIRYKLDQFGFYIGIIIGSVALVMMLLHFKMGYDWADSLRFSTVQTMSVISTTGSVIDDTNLWWTPIQFLFLVLTLCGGMAGATTGGLKVMRVLILMRNVRTILYNKLHPNAVNPVRLNRYPVSQQMITNVMVIFFVYVFVIIVSVLGLMMCHISPTESIGAVFACITSYGPGLGACGGFGNYAAFGPMAKMICAVVMLMGRLECMSVLILFFPAFWKK